MSEQQPASSERLSELLADRAVFGLSVEEDKELRELLRVYPDAATEDFDHLVATLDGLTACAANLPPAPPAVVARVQSQAPYPAPVIDSGRSGAWTTNRELLAWLTTAACLLLAVYAWTRKSDVPNPMPNRDPSPLAKRDFDNGSAVPSVVPTLAQQWDELLASSEGVLSVRLSDSTDPTGLSVTGDIVWSPTQQRGFLRIQGLPSNDPAQSQYQLWLVQATPMQSETVNGGVFDVEQPTRELIVPIRAEHFVQQPNMLVVSIEPPGGSSDLTVSGYPLVAKVGNSPE